jgi:hypothetical protein
MEPEVWRLPASVPLIALGLFFAAILGVIIRSTLQERRQRRERHEELLSFGFTLLAAAPTGLVRKVGAFRGGGTLRSGGDRTGPLTLQNVYHREIAGGDVYLFDVKAADDGASSGPISANLAVIAPALHLPRLTLVPELNLDGPMGDMLGRMAKNALQWANTRMGLQPVILEAMPAFAHHYTALGSDAGAVRAFLTPARLTGLLTLDRKYAIEGEDDTFVLSTGLAAVMAGGRGGEREATEPYTLGMDAEALLALFCEQPHDSAT